MILRKTLIDECTDDDYFQKKKTLIDVKQLKNKLGFIKKILR